MTRTAEIQRPLTSRAAFRGAMRSASDGVEFAGREELIKYIKQEIAADDGTRYTSSELRQSLSREIGISL